MKYCLCLLIFIGVFKAYSQSVIRTENWEMQLDPEGYIKQLVFKDKGRDTIPYL